MTAATATRPRLSLPDRLRGLMDECDATAAAQYADPDQRTALAHGLLRLGLLEIIEQAEARARKTSIRREPAPESREQEAMLPLVQPEQPAVPPKVDEPSRPMPAEVQGEPEPQVTTTPVVDAPAATPVDVHPAAPPDDRPANPIPAVDSAVDGGASAPPATAASVPAAAEPGTATEPVPEDSPGRQSPGTTSDTSDTKRATVRTAGTSGGRHRLRKPQRQWPRIAAVIVAVVGLALLLVACGPSYANATTQPAGSDTMSNYRIVGSSGDLDALPVDSVILQLRIGGRGVGAVLQKVPGGGWNGIGGNAGDHSSDWVITGSTMLPDVALTYVVLFDPSVDILPDAS